MTRAWRAGILIALFAALLGAPRAVLAAPPNQLSAATASPTSGSTITMFTFGVRYTSTTAAAGVVTVSVAGLTLPMPRVSGSATDGTYRVSSLLPAGSWVPTFEAYPLKGPHPSISGPQIHVAALATPKPSMLPSPTALDVAPPSSAAAEPGDDPATPTALAEPQPTAGAVSAPGDEAPAPGSEPAASTPNQVEPSAGAVTATPGGGGARPAAPVAPAPGTTASGSPESAASPSGNRRSPAPGPAAAPFAGSNAAWTTLALAGFGAAALGILAIAWILLGRRRRGDGDQPLPAAAAVSPGGTTEHDGAPLTPSTEQLLGRAARRSRLDPSDDPIVAAMGLSPRSDAAPRDTRPRYAAGQVSRGPGERPLSEAKRRRRS